jgi:hypothetical protein
MKSRFTILLAVISLFLSCDKVPLTSPTGSTITLAVNQTSVPINGAIQVTAAVIEAGGTAVHDGTTVTFTGGLGTFNPIDAQTVGGIARTIFTGTTSGTVKIGAFSGGAKATEIEVKIGAAAAGSLSLQVVPPNVGQNGGSVTVTALVLDASGNALPGVPVVFSTDVGTLSNANVISDSNGYAVTSLVTTRQAKVTARAGTATPAEFTVNVSSAPTVTIASSPSSPIAGQPVAFTITPSTASTASPLQSVVIDFGDGQTATLGGITGPTGVTHTYNNAGGYTVTVRATDITGSVGISSTAIVVGFPALPTVSLAVSPNPIPPAQNGFATITVTAAAATGGAPLRSVVVRKADGTVIFSGSSGGAFAYQFTAGSGATPITATVTDAAGVTATTTTVVLVQ